ncbi:aspartyl-phosphate phosphatase Spo0E family protein [Priestia sp. BR_2]
MDDTRVTQKVLLEEIEHVKEITVNITFKKGIVSDNMGKVSQALDKKLNELEEIYKKSSYFMGLTP